MDHSLLKSFATPFAISIATRLDTQFTRSACLLVTFKDVRAVTPEPGEHVNFNKNVLPLFIAEIEYYSYLSYARLFRSAKTLAEQLLFWKREEGRLLKFTEEHKEFLEYYENEKTNMDQLYFGEAVNPYGTIISGYMALKMYTKYVRDELDVLSGFSK